jgi:dTDP-4-dehydrorhamnose 3,5-epimerase-like enzyme
MIEQPRLIEGGLAIDDRGSLAFVNEFTFEGVRRFYVVSNHRNGFVRAWHGHRREAKYVMALSGAAIVGVVRIDDWDNPARDLPVQRYVLTEYKPTLLYIPTGYANGFKTLKPETRLLFLSTATLEESRGDDRRYDAHYWDAWHVVER